MDAKGFVVDGGKLIAFVVRPWDGLGTTFSGGGTGKCHEKKNPWIMPPPGNEGGLKKMEAFRCPKRGRVVFRGVRRWSHGHHPFTGAVSEASRPFYPETLAILPKVGASQELVLILAFC